MEKQKHKQKPWPEKTTKFAINILDREAEKTVKEERKKRKKNVPSLFSMQHIPPVH